MINIPKGFNNGILTQDFITLVDFFNDLEKKLEYPNSEGYTDQARYLKQAMQDLIMWGKI